MCVYPASRPSGPGPAPSRTPAGPRTSPGATMENTTYGLLL